MWLRNAKAAATQALATAPSEEDFLPAPPTQPIEEPETQRGERHITVRWALQPGHPEPEEFEVQYGFRIVGAS